MALSQKTQPLIPVNINQFTVLHCDPGRAFQLITEAHVVYVYVIVLFGSAALPRSPTAAIYPEGMKRTTNLGNGMSKWSFLFSNRT